jgi:putative membrane protein
VFTFASVALASHFAGPHFGFGLFFLLIPVTIFVLFLIFAATFGRRYRRRMWNEGWGPHGHWAQQFSASKHAESTLAERFAQGDIDEKEYRARLEVLRANATPQ